MIGTHEPEQRMRVVVVGGGTAGWMTAAALGRFLGDAIDIRLIESAEIGIIGVGEATLPHLRAFVARIGLDEAEFMRATRATMKLGIELRDFGRIGESYIHPFGDYGFPLAGLDFHHYWLRQHASGDPAPIEAYSLPILAARAGKFAVPRPGEDELSDCWGYAYQFDATLFAPLLRRQAESFGVRRTEGRIVDVVQDGASGDITALTLAGGEVVEGDFFVDCSGFASLLIGRMGEDNWEDWSRWLPCDRAAALPCTSPEGEIAPFTTAAAMAGGWRWRIPLQHRVGNGYVFSSAHVSEEEACREILSAVEGEPLADPRILRFRTGRRRRSWVGNVVSIGLASGFLEPLESTSIHLAQVAIMRLIELFPTGAVSPIDRDEFNRLIDYEYDRVRDFLILHYHATTRTDSPFWNHVRTMDVPATLESKIALWREAGRVEHYGEGLFRQPSWIAVYLGQGVAPEGYDQRAERIAPDQLERAMGELRGELQRRAAAMPSHREHLVSSGAWADA
jgi:tryptophan halogenase